MTGKIRREEKGEEKDARFDCGKGRIEGRYHKKKGLRDVEREETVIKE